MPGMDGLQATRSIRALPESEGTVPIIGLSASVSQDEQDAGLAAGMDQYLSKLIRSEELLAALPSG
ncbi:MAG: CheY-like chemotaxis protein [Myxococcota bacterium]|jgi:CheY-like chemotaxis protein